MNNRNICILAITNFIFITLLTLLTMLGMSILRNKIKELDKKFETQSLIIDKMTTNQYMMLLLYNRDHNEKEFLELNGKFGILWPTNK